MSVWTLVICCFLLGSGAWFLCFFSFLPYQPLAQESPLLTSVVQDDSWAWRIHWTQTGLVSEGELCLRSASESWPGCLGGWSIVSTAKGLIKGSTPGQGISLGSGFNPGGEATYLSLSLLKSIETYPCEYLKIKKLNQPVKKFLFFTEKKSGPISVRQRSEEPQINDLK